MTEEEFLALPVGTVVSATDGPQTYQKVDDDHWETSDENFKQFQLQAVEMLAAIGGSDMKPWFTDDQLLQSLDIIYLVNS